VRDVAAGPGAPDAQAALYWQLRRLLAEDPALAVKAAGLGGKTQAAGSALIIAGERSVAVGGGIGDNITGDQSPCSKVEKGGNCRP